MTDTYPRWEYDREDDVHLLYLTPGGQIAAAATATGVTIYDGDTATDHPAVSVPEAMGVAEDALATALVAHFKWVWYPSITTPWKYLHLRRFLGETEYLATICEGEVVLYRGVKTGTVKWRKSFSTDLLAYEALSKYLGEPLPPLPGDT